MKIPTIYCINLKYCRDRRKRMENRFKNLGLLDKVVFIDAIPRTSPLIDYYYQYSGKTDPNSDDPNTKAWRSSMACQASHLKAIRTFLEQGDDECLICEDDVMFKNDFLEAYEKLRSNVPDNTPCVSLSYMNNSWEGCNWTGIDSAKYNLCMSNPEELWGLQLYWISKDHAIKCLTDFDKPYINGESHNHSEVIVKVPGCLLSYPVLAIEECIDSERQPEHVEWHKMMFDQWGRSNYTDGEKPYK